MDLLLIDNSNIFIEVQNLVGRDGRFDYDKFVKNYTNFKNQKKIIVGSTPPKSDAFWSTMRSREFDVFVYERTKSGEKSVDTRIVAEGIEFITNQNRPGTLILMSGDLDMRVLVEKAHDRGWDIILWSWKKSLNNEYMSGDLSICLDVKCLDDLQDDLVFFDVEFDGICQKEYWGDRKKRLENEKREREFNRAKQSAVSNIEKFNHLDNKEIYLNQLNNLTDLNKISEIDNILYHAKKEEKDNKIKWEHQQEKQRLQAKEDKKLAQKEVLKQKWDKITVTAFAVVGIGMYCFKKIKK